MSSLAATLKSKFKTAENYRRPFECKWVASLRQIKGLYDKDKLSTLEATPHASTVYAKLTRSKVFPLIAKLYNMLYPTNDKNWGIRPTPVPKVPPEVLSMIVGEVRFNAQGTPITVDMVEAAVNAYAALTCEKMEKVIEDQLEELKYHQIAKETIVSGVYYGTGVIKGPLSISK